METIFTKLFSKDIFGKWDIKPWWEKIRAIILFVLLGLAILLVLCASALSIHCVPSDHTVVLTEQQTKKVEVDCMEIIPHWLKMIPIKNLALTLVVWGIDVMWFGIPRVEQTFKTLTECDETVRSLTCVESDRIADIVRRMVVGESQLDSRLSEDLIKLKRVCRNLWKPNSKLRLSIAMLYLLRNTLSATLTGISLSGLPSISSENRLPCKPKSWVRNSIRLHFQKSSLRVGCFGWLGCYTLHFCSSCRSVNISYPRLSTEKY